MLITLNPYKWLLFYLCFFLIDVSVGHSIRSTLTVNPVSRYDILGDEAKTQQGTCGRGSASTNDINCSPEEGNVSCVYECNLLHDPPSRYNDSCEFIEENCDGEYELLNYLQFMECRLGPNLRPLGYIMLVLWLLYLLSLLSTTVDNFFVPVLHMLSDKLHLPPSIAGMTLLALGNGAPDIFVAFSALQDDDVPLVLGALMGAGLFITTTVLATVLLVTKGRNYNIDKIDFTRDIVAYMVVLAVIVGVVYDGKVHVEEVILFPIVYVLYVVAVLLISFLRKWWEKRKQGKDLETEEVKFNKSDDEITVIITKKFKPEEENRPKTPSPLEYDKHPGHDGPMLRDAIEKAIEEENKAEEEEEEEVERKEKIVLAGLTWPKGFFKRVHFVLEWPFSLLRWMTIPPCCHDGRWSVFHFMFAVFSPVPMTLVLLAISGDHWGVYTMTVGSARFPVPVLVLLIVPLLCVLFFFTLSWKKPPNMVMQIVLMISAFVMSIVWLYVIANEVVSVLQALGLLTKISTAILGLTVLAIGNSVADWVADTVVARRGKPEMAFASCFGAPLITHVMGLSFAIIGQMLTDTSKIPYNCFDVRSDDFVHVKLAWIFLAFSLFGSFIAFIVYGFKPPNEHGYVLIYIYAVFMIFSILVETGVMKISL